MILILLRIIIIVVYIERKYDWNQSVSCNKLSTQKQPGCKKPAALFKMASVKKVVKLKGGGQEMAVMV